MNTNNNYNLPPVDPYNNYSTNNNYGLPPVYQETNKNDNYNGQVAVVLAGSTSYAPPVIFQQSPPSQQEIVTYVGVNSPKNRSWLAWSVVNTIIFFPLIIFWAPALVCSIMAGQSNR